MEPVHYIVCLVYLPAHVAGTKLYLLLGKKQMCVNKLLKVALNSVADGNEPAISNRKSNAITITPDKPHCRIKTWFMHTQKFKTNSPHHS